MSTRRVGRHVKAPIIEEIAYSATGLGAWEHSLINPADAGDSARAMYLLDYPTVYIVHDEVEERYSVYIGETTNIRGRTKQHLLADPRKRDDWRDLADSASSRMFVIGHDLFNKSLTLDIENRLMLYLTGVDKVNALHNRRANPPNKYHTQEDFDEIFSKIWRQLRTKNRHLFPTEQVIRDSALFKASPFHKLTQQQITAKAEVLDIIYRTLQNSADNVVAQGKQVSERGNLIMVRGEAGAGKTVLLSSIFYELFQPQVELGDDPTAFQPLNTYLLVNNDQHQKVYEGIARKLGLVKANDGRVSKPTRFITNTRVDADDPVDVVLIDEAHLLWTQGKQSYRGKNQLFDILDRARVVVAIFDDKQIMATNQYWENSLREEIEKRTVETITLTNQMRIPAAPSTVAWIRAIVDDGLVNTLSVNSEYKDESGYEVRIFDDPSTMWKQVAKHADSGVERGLSRMLATFDWPYSSAKTHKTPFVVDVGDFSLPWNREYERLGRLDVAQKRSIRGKSWVEQPHTINEVGSTFTVQGFDLNYAGLILGESVKYRNGRVVFDIGASKNSNATQQRTLEDGSKMLVGEQLLRNELNVLLTRGVRGLYIYAVDDALRAALKEQVTRA